MVLQQLSICETVLNTEITQAFTDKRVHFGHIHTHTILNHHYGLQL